MRGLPRRVWIGGKAAVSGTLIFALLWRVDWGALRAPAGELDFALVGLGGLGLVAIAALEVGRLRVVLEPLRLSWLRGWRLYLIGVFLGSFLPGQLGGDVYKVAALRGEGVGLVRLAALVLVLRALGFALLVAGALIGVWLLWPLPELRGQLGGSEEDLSRAGAWLVFTGLLVASAVAIAVVTVGRFRSVGKSVWRTFRLLSLSQAGRLSWLSALIHMIRCLVLYLFVLSVGANIPPSVTLLAASATALFSILPISIGGLGVREASVAVLLTRFSVGYEQAVLVALLGRAFMVLFALAGGVWMLGSNAGTKGLGHLERDA